MGINNCKTCQRTLGSEVLTCPYLNQSNCEYESYQTIKVSRPLVYWLVLFGGILIITLSLPLMRLQINHPAWLQIIEFLMLAFLLLTGVFMFIVGYFVVRSRQIFIIEKNTKNYYLKYALAGIEARTLIISDWLDINLPVKLPTNDPDHLPIDHESLTRQEIVEELSAIILTLVFQGHFRMRQANVYEASAQQLDQVTYQPKIFLSVLHPPLFKNKNSVETLIFSQVEKMQNKRPANLPVYLGDLIAELIKQKKLPEVKLNLAEREDYQINVQVMQLENPNLNPELVKRGISEGFEVNNFDLLHQFKQQLNSKNIRVFLIVTILFCFFFMRFISPLFYAQKIVKKVDTKQITKEISAGKEFVTTQYQDLLDGIKANKTYGNIKGYFDTETWVDLTEGVTGETRESYESIKAKIENAYNSGSDQVKYEVLNLIDEYQLKAEDFSDEILSGISSNDTELALFAIELATNSKIDSRVLRPVLEAKSVSDNIYIKSAVEDALNQLK